MLLVSLKFDLVPAALASLGLVLVFLFLRLLGESSQMQSFLKEIPRIFFRVKSTLDLTNLNRFLLTGIQNVGMEKSHRNKLVFTKYKFGKTSKDS